MNVYDFDNTIYDGESTFDFFVYCVGKHPSLLRFLPKVMVVVARYKMCRISKNELLELVAEHQREFLKIAGDMEKLTKGFWDKNIHKIKSFYKDVQKEDDLILTASPELTIKEIAKRLGIKNIVCSKIADETGYVTRICMRQNKILALKEDFGDVEIDDFYTDSIKNDGFLAEYAKRVFLVEGDRITQIK